MSYVVVTEFKHGTRAQYDAVVGEVHPPDRLPAGQTQHYAGPSAGGWVVTAVFNTKQDWDSFRDGTLLPGLGKVGDAGMPGPPVITEFEAEVTH
jgi:hypothetical protein